MLVNRILQPNKEDIFYHYCSVDTLLSIAEFKKIRFSDVNMLNDYEEARYGYKLFEQAANSLLNDQAIQKKHPELNHEFFDKVDEILSPQQLFQHPVISCFSRSADILSQWRAYAQDGKGFSIGLRGSSLAKLPVTLLEVEYEPENQLNEMKVALMAVYLRMQAKDYDDGSNFRQDCALLGAWSLAFKNPSFKEEREIRCLHMLDVRTDGDMPSLIDAGGVSDGTEIDGETVNFRNSNGSIIAYVDLPFRNENNSDIISEIWLGPKNENGTGDIVYMMSRHGLKGYELKKSTSTYR